MKELGIKMVFVDPYFNPTAELFADKWFAPRLGTDVAFGLGIAYTWLIEDLYDKEYVASAPPASTNGRTTCSARPTACPRPPSGPRASAASPPGR